MFRMPKHSTIKVVAPKEEEEEKVVRNQVHGNCRKNEI